MLASMVYRPLPVAIYTSLGYVHVLYRIAQHEPKKLRMQIINRNQSKNGNNKNNCCCSLLNVRKIVLHSRNLRFYIEFSERKHFYNFNYRQMEYEFRLLVKSQLSHTCGFKVVSRMRISTEINKLQRSIFIAKVRVSIELIL